MYITHHPVASVDSHAHAVAAWAYMARHSRSRWEKGRGHLELRKRAVMESQLTCATAGAERRALVIVPSRVHFSGEMAVFEAGRGKNPNFSEVKRETEKCNLAE